MVCELCEMKKLTRWIYQDDMMVVCDCKSCGYGKILVVFRPHREPSEEEFEKMKDKAFELFGKHIAFRLTRMKIRDHPHFHIVKWC